MAHDLLPLASHAPHCLLKATSGSHAYGLNLPHSDVDIRGVFYAPLELLYGLQMPDQVSDSTNDTTFFELGRFVELALKNNPNILELLATPEDCVHLRHPVMELFPVEMFLSKRCRDSFAGYAVAQIKKARGLNKKIVNPMPDERKTLVDFCHVAADQGTVPLATWMERHGLAEKHLGLTDLPHVKYGYAIYHDPTGQWGLRGFLSNDASTYLSTSTVPREARPLGWMWFNKDAYAKHCKDWSEYQTWVAERNGARYETTLTHGKGYDAKNMMHTIRLLDLAEKIAQGGRFTVRCENREELLAIRRGEREYEALVEEAELRLARIDELFASSRLPDEPNAEQVESALIAARRQLYAI
jgi:uncharacterized protein